MKRDIFINFIFTLLISMIMFIQNKYFVQYLGIEILGIMKLFTQLLQYLNIVELGLGSATTFALYKPLAEKNREQISIIISTIKSIYNKISLILLSLGIFITPFLTYFIKLDNFTKDIYFYWIFYVINTVSTYLYIKYIILFTANQEFIYVRLIQSISKIFYQTLQIIFIIKYSSFLLFIFLLFLDNLTQYIFFKIHYQKKYSYIYITKKRYKGLYKDIKNLFWHKIGSLIVFNTDLILISKLVSIETVGVYASYQLVLQIISTIVNTILNVIRPKLGKFISMNSKIEIFELFKKINIIFLYIGIFLTYNTYILINNFIKIWLGEEYTLTKFTLLLIGINLFIKIFGVIVESFKEACGFFDDIQSPILESIINLVFSIILGMKYGLDGIIIGTIISNILVIIIYKPIIVFKRCFDKGVSEYIKIYGNYLFLLSGSLIILSIITGISREKDVNTWIDWLIYATITSIKTGGGGFIIFLFNKEFRNIIYIYILKRKNNNGKLL